MSVLRLGKRDVPSGAVGGMLLPLDPPRPVPVQQLRFVEIEPGVFQLTDASAFDAVLEQAESGVYQVTDSPGGAARARMALVNTTAIVYG